MLQGLFSACGKSGLLFSCSAWAYHHGGLSRYGAQAVWHVGSVSVASRRAQAH